MKKQTLQAKNKFVLIREIVSKGVAMGDQIIRLGEILSVGEQTENFKKGEKVFFDTYKSQKLNHEGNFYWSCEYTTISTTL